MGCPNNNCHNSHKTVSDYPEQLYHDLPNIMELSHQISSMKEEIKSLQDKLENVYYIIYGETRKGKHIEPTR